VLVANLPAAIQQWQADRAGAIKSLVLLLAYFAYIGLGIVLLTLIVPEQDTGPVPGDKGLEITS
jgi:hypothetical protein